MSHPQKFVDLVDKLIRNAKALVASSHGGYVKEGHALRRWSNDLILLRSLGGPMLGTWASRLSHNGIVIVLSEIEGPLAALETIKFAIEDGLLESYRSLVVAEACADLYAQGQHLFEKGYFLAAGVIFRAVLEEKLRELCLGAACMPEKDRPTISDFNQALYKCESITYDKSMMLNMTALASVGNDAAHNKESLKKEDVERLMRGTLDFISRYSPA